MLEEYKLLKTEIEHLKYKLEETKVKLADKASENITIMVRVIEEVKTVTESRGQSYQWIKDWNW